MKVSAYVKVTTEPKWREMGVGGKIEISLKMVVSKYCVESKMINV